jgi:hypothetical protein
VRKDGIERLESDGTVVYTHEARAIMAAIDPELAEPLVPQRAIERLPRLIAALTRHRSGEFA